MTAFRALAAAVLLLFLIAVGATQAQERAKQHRIAMIRPAGSLYRKKQIAGQAASGVIWTA